MLLVISTSITKLVLFRCVIDLNVNYNSLAARFFKRSFLNISDLDYAMFNSLVPNSFCKASNSIDNKETSFYKADKSSILPEHDFYTFLNWLRNKYAMSAKIWKKFLCLIVCTGLGRFKFITCASISVIHFHSLCPSSNPTWQVSFENGTTILNHIL